MTPGVPAGPVRGDARLRRRAVVRRRLGFVGALAAASLALAVSCSGDDDSDSATPDESTTSPRPTTTAPPEEEPPGTEPAEVKPYIEGLLDRYSDIVNRIVADPEIAANPEHALYDDLRSLMAPDSEMTQPIIDALVERGEDGVSQRPFGDGPSVVRELDGDVETTSINKVSFPICTRQSYRLFDAEGDQIEYSDGLNQPGQGVAVRVEGHWLIDRFNVLEAGNDCPGSQQ